ncbi:protein-tyrosine phosphatase-like protein [Mortierella sp. GBAus27b]|nr:protein tyrosine phosphatase, non-receptor type 11 [Mortierella sp. GBA43]KAI8359290.1 protein-tyrosine phosphatase-like protein [Mortierella sp. GBAus27b]
MSSPSLSAASLARLPGFLRPTSAASKIATQQQLFQHQNQLERQRLQDANNANSPFSVAQALDESTQDLNRYGNILPYKHSQVVVGTPLPLQPHLSFINANRITAPPTLRTSLPPAWRGYIATQAPLPDTQTQFWRMVYEQNVHVIVCLTAVSHDRLNRGPKAERYWPRAGQTDQLNKDLHVMNTDSVDRQDQVTYRHLDIWNPSDTTTNKRRKVLLVHYQGWPDHGVPTQTDDLRDILREIRTWKAEQLRQQQIDPPASTLLDLGPTVVHCSAGCGRTGTFCVVDTALSVLEHTRYPYLTTSVSGGGGSSSTSLPDQGSGNDMYDWQGDRDIVNESLSSFRTERMLMVQTSGQYSFCYKAVRDLCQV